MWPIIERPSVLEEDEALLARLGLRLAIWSGTSLHGSMHPASRSRAVDRSQDILPGGRRAGKRVSWAEGLADDRAPSSRGEWWGVLQEFQRLGGSLAHTIKTGLGLGGGLCQSKPNGLAALLHQRGSMVIVALRDDANEGVQAARENVVAFAGLQKTQDVPCQWCSRRHRGSSTTSPEGKAAGSESGSGNGGCREQARTSPHGPTKVRFRQEGVEEEALVRQGDARQLKTQVFFCPPDSCILLYTFERVRHRGARWSCSSTHTHVRANLTVFDLCIHRHNAAQGYAFCALEETEMYVPPSLQGSGLTRALCRTRWMLAQSLGASHVISPRSSSVALSSATFHAAREKLGYRLGDGYYQLCVHTMTKQSHVALPSTCFETSTCCVQPQHGQAPPESVQEEVTAVTEDVQECQRQPNRQVRALQ